MNRVTEKSRIIYLVILIIFISGFGVFWMDYIGLIDIYSKVNELKGGPESVMTASGDEPSLLEREEFEKEKMKLLERIEDLDKREVLIGEKEKNLDAEDEKLKEIKKGLELEKKRFLDEKKKSSGYMKNVRELADKIANMPPDQSVKIMEKWEDTLVIDVLRQMDENAREAGKASITSYLITLLPKEKASRIMYLMTQL